MTIQIESHFGRNGAEIDPLHDNGLWTCELPVPDFGTRIARPTAVTALTCKKFRERERIDYADLPADPSKRMEALSFRHFQLYCQFLKGVVDQHKCRRCWFLQENCICQIFQQVTEAVFRPHRILLLMHFRELNRSSNSGRILLSSEANRAFVFGMPRHEQALIQSLKQDDRQAIILWPGPESVTIDELAYAEGIDIGAPFQIIALDGTWSNSRAMNRRLPKSIPRVRLSNSHRQEFGGARKHANKVHICTAGACLHVLRELGVAAAQLRPLGDAINLCFDNYAAQLRRERLRD